MKGMAKQEELRSYLNDVNSWLEEVSIFIVDLNNDTGEEDIQLLINETKELVNKQLEDSKTNESKILMIQRSVSDINQSLKPLEAKRNRIQTAIPIGKHILPPLPYEYNALEPYISEEIMRLHHDKHHKSYVDGLNKAETMLEEARNKNRYELIKHWEREAAFHGSGHYLHTIFWEVMNPHGGGMPQGELAKQIRNDFRSYDLFKKHFSEAAKKVEGVGWSILVWSPRSHRLEILQAERHQFLTQWDTIPLLVLDVWEHAYYLQYKNNRDQYVDAWWNIVYWRNVEKRFEEAKKLKWKPF